MSSDVVTISKSDAEWLLKALPALGKLIGSAGVKAGLVEGSIQAAGNCYIVADRIRAALREAS